MTTTAARVYLGRQPFNHVPASSQLSVHEGLTHELSTPPLPPHTHTGNQRDRELVPRPEAAGLRVLGDPGLGDRPPGRSHVLYLWQRKPLGPNFLPRRLLQTASSKCRSNNWPYIKCLECYSFQTQPFHSSLHPIFFFPF